MTIPKETCCDLKVVSRLLKSYRTPSHFLSQVLDSVCSLSCIWCHLIWTAVSVNEVHLPQEMHTSKMSDKIWINESGGRVVAHDCGVQWFAVWDLMLCLDFFFIKTRTDWGCGSELASSSHMCTSLRRFIYAEIWMDFGGAMKSFGVPITSKRKPASQM